MTMRSLSILGAALLASMTLSGVARAQCAGGLIVNCPPVVNPQPTDVLPVWQLGQNPHSRAATLSTLLGGGGTLPGNFSTLAVTNNATIGGTLGVTGNTTLSNATVGGTLGVAGNTTIGGTLGVTGALNLAHNQNTINVLDYGAVGNGTTDDTAAIQAAATACPAAGCTLYFPPGYTFGVSGTALLKSNTHVLAYGATIKAIAPIASSPDGSFFSNVNYTATTLTDSNIIIEGGTLDYGVYSNAVNAAHNIGLWHVNHVQILNVIGYGRSSAAHPGGGDFVACPGCNDVLVQGNTANYYANAFFDFWFAPTNVRVIGNYAITDTIEQPVNFNPDPTTGAAPGNSANGMVLAGNTIIVTGATSSPLMLEPLNASETTVNVIVSDNYFSHVYVVIRGPTSNVTISGNVFENLSDGVAAVLSYAQKGGTPDGIGITGNTVVNPQTSSGSEGVFRLEATNSSITGNTITGSGFYADTATGTQPVVISGNAFPIGYNGQQNIGSAWVSDSTKIQLPPLIDAGAHAAFNIPPTGAPSFIVNGDVWATTAGLFYYPAGVANQLLMTKSTQTAAGFIGTWQVPLIQGRNGNGSAFPITTPTSGDFGLIWGTGGINLLRSESANSSTITDTAVWELTLPDTYIAGTNITVQVYCGYVVGSGTIGTHTLTGAAYSINAFGGGLSSNLIATAAQSVPSSANTLTFTITGTSLIPGARVLLSLAMALQDTGGHAIYGNLFNVNLL